jgi:hypothetical protein
MGIDPVFPIDLRMHLVTEVFTLEIESSGVAYSNCSCEGFTAALLCCMNNEENNSKARARNFIDASFCYSTLEKQKWRKSVS